MVDQGTISRKLQLQRTKTGADTPTGVSETGATWTEIWSAAGQTGGSLYNGEGPTVENFRNVIEAGVISANATTIRVKFQASSGGMTITGAGIGKRSGTSDDYLADPSPVRFQYGGDNISVANPIVLGAGESAYSDALTFTIDETVNYLIHVWNGNGFADYSAWAEAGVTNSYYSGTATDFSVTVSYTGSTATLLVGIASIEKYE